jgi:hypothetical protein
MRPYVFGIGKVYTEYSHLILGRPLLQAVVPHRIYLTSIENLELAFRRTPHIDAHV